MENANENSLLFLQREVIRINTEFAEAQKKFKAFESECITKISEKPTPLGVGWIALRV